MRKRIVLVFLSFFCISMCTYGIDAWIRINQLGYLPNAQKKAVLISESPLAIKQFAIYDALTNQELGTFKTVTSRGEFENFKSTYILDFSSFKLQGAYYIKADLIYSPTIYINKNIYQGTADFLLNFLRLQRNGYDPDLYSEVHQYNTYDVTELEASKTINSERTIDSAFISSIRSKHSRYKKVQLPVELPGPTKPRSLDVRGGWLEATDYLQYGATSATAIFQLLFAYQLNPTAFSDKYDAYGYNKSNDIPDILDEAKWGLDWLIKMYPTKDVLYHQIADDLEHGRFGSPKDNKTNNEPEPAISRPVYPATGKPQGSFGLKNNSSGMASIAGKYSSAFCLGADLLNTYYPGFADSLKNKAIEAYQYGKESPGVCQSVPGKSPYFFEEENWKDDMELAAAQLYRLTYDGNYLRDAAEYGRIEPVSPWLCSDTARFHQWYPYLNLGHYVIANVENPGYRKEFLQNMLNGIQRMNTSGADNPFDVAVPMVLGSNNMVTALASQCRLYRTMTGDSTYMNLETSLVDWLFGRNPWGMSMVIGLPKSGVYPSDPHSTLSHNSHVPLTGALINGPVNAGTFKTLIGNHLSKEDMYDQVQSDWAVYHDDNADYATNEPTIDGTAALTYLLSCKQLETASDKTVDNNHYKFGGITTTDMNKKQISLVFTGNEFSDGAKTILNTLKNLKIKASFFFTGDFYRNKNNKQLIEEIKKENYYLGAHSDKNLLYCSFQKRDSMLVNKNEFLNDLKTNYMEMEKFGIYKNQAPFFLPPLECYNDLISQWCNEFGLQVISSTPKTLSNADNSIPEMRNKYYSSNEIYNNIIEIESTQGLNGYILVFHIGSDSKRKDKFYPKLNALLSKLNKGGYEFVDLCTATNMFNNSSVTTDKKQKRKN
jgi:endoglucanase